MRALTISEIDQVAAAHMNNCVSAEVWAIREESIKSQASQSAFLMSGLVGVAVGGIATLAVTGAFAVGMGMVAGVVAAPWIYIYERENHDIFVI